MTRIKTFSYDNKFSFACPIFGSYVEMGECMKLRDMVWRGERIAERQGCQVLMKSDKCPINTIVKDAVRNGDDPYFSTEHKIGHLDNALLRRIGPILTPESLLNRFVPTDEEREAIITANTRAGDNAKADVKKPRKPITIKRLAKAPEPHEKEKIDAETEAAFTGDLGAALTKAVQSEMKKVEEASIPDVVDETRKEPVPIASKPDAFVRTPPADGLSLLEMARRARAARETQQGEGK